MTNGYELSSIRMGRLIGAALKEDGLAQAEFARRVGASQKHLCGVVNGTVAASPATLDYWAFVLGRHWHITLERTETR